MATQPYRTPEGFVSWFLLSHLSSTDAVLVKVQTYSDLTRTSARVHLGASGALQQLRRIRGTRSCKIFALYQV